MRKQLLKAVVHDLKTPLACIIGALEIYQRSKESLSDTQKATLLKTALQEARRLEEMLTRNIQKEKIAWNEADAQQEQSEKATQMAQEANQAKSDFSLT